MKFQQLRIHNIASIEDAFIDFEAEPLATSEVFLITGKTGAGKSTILDSICLALYADTPRLDSTNMQGNTLDFDREVRIDDPRQLMRRNTTEASVSLTFVGSNEVHYEAVWSVARAYKKISGAIKPKNWLLHNLDTDQTLNRDNEIRAEIHAAVGLDFSQFCRTTMLAQGEFTRFLNSKDDEKAEILEKLTGVDVYSKIGAKVFDLTTQQRMEWEEARQKVEGVQLFTDEELSQKQELLTMIDAREKQLKATADGVLLKYQWLQSSTELLQKLTAAAQAKEQAEAVIQSEAYMQRARLVKEWNATIDARAWMAEIAQAEAQQLRQQAVLDALATDYTQMLGGLCQATQEADRLATLTNITFDKQEAEIREQEKALAAYNLPDLRAQRDRVKDLINKIEAAKERIETLNKERQRNARQQSDLKAMQDSIGKKQQELTALEPVVHDAKLAMEVRKVDLDKQSDTVSKFVKTLRLKLHSGDVCPVCRQTIVQGVPHEEELSALVAGLQKLYDESEKQYKTLSENKLRIEAELKAANDAYQRLLMAIEQEKALPTAEKRAQDACMLCGIEQVDESASPMLDALYESNLSSRQQIDITIAEAEAKEMIVKKLRTDLDSKRREFEQQKDRLNRIRITCQNVRNVIDSICSVMPMWQELVPGDVHGIENLMGCANDINTRVAMALSQQKAAAEVASQRKDWLEAFLSGQESLGKERLAELARYTMHDIQQQQTLLDQERSHVIACQTLHASAQRLYDEHLQRRPQLTEEESVETLEQTLAVLNRQIGEEREQRGALAQELKLNEENRQRLGALAQVADAKHEEYLKWSRLNQLLGNATGTTFRKIAQSYVLTHLIQSANCYMRQLTDRYTLKVTPGTFVISIEDAYQGYVCRAASTISGGESFLVSLSLALALSDIDQQWQVDTLFIDEGFGTLSGEPLQKAVETLRSLHSKTGRHVGIISHVDELQERIPVQIRVNQEGTNSSSTICIVP